VIIGCIIFSVGERKNSLQTLNFMQPENYPFDGLS